MKDHGLLFKGEMIRAFLAGNKTMTRRIPTKHNSVCASARFDDLDLSQAWIDGDKIKAPRHSDATIHRVFCKYAVGDRIYAKESYYCAPYTTDLLGYVATDDHPHQSLYRIKPSIFMPKSFARIWLEIVSVTPQKLQDISEEDAIAEGVRSGDDYEDHIGDDRDFRLCPDCGGSLLHGAAGVSLGYVEVDCFTCDTYKKRFRILWDVINGKSHPWSNNPTVWVIGLEER